MKVKSQSEVKVKSLSRVLEWGAIAFSSWKLEGEKVEAVIDFIFLGSKITVDSDCNCEKRRPDDITGMDSNSS